MLHSGTHPTSMSAPNGSGGTLRSSLALKGSPPVALVSSSSSKPGSASHRCSNLPEQLKKIVQTTSAFVQAPLLLLAAAKATVGLVPGVNTSSYQADSHESSPHASSAVARLNLGRWAYSCCPPGPEEALFLEQVSVEVFNYFVERKLEGAGQATAHRRRVSLKTGVCFFILLTLANLIWLSLGGKSLHNSTTTLGRLT